MQKSCSRSLIHRILRSGIVIWLFVTLAACGGGSKGSEEDNSQLPSTPDTSGTGTLKSNAYVLTAAQAAGSKLTADTFTVKKPQSRIHAVGDVLVVDDHGGRLIRIEAVSETAGAIVYGYSLASLTDVFETLNVTISGALGPADLGETISTNNPEIEIGWIKSATATASGTKKAQEVSAGTNSLQITYKNLGISTGSGIEIDGTSSFVLNPDISLHLATLPGQTLPSLEIAAKINPNLQTSVSITSQNGGQISYNIIADPIYLPAFKRVIIVPVMGVPVPVPFWVRPVINISGSIAGSAAGSFATVHKYGVTGVLGLSRVATGLWVPEVSVAHTASMDVSEMKTVFGVTINAPKVELFFQIYGLAGPSFDYSLEAGIQGQQFTAPALPDGGIQKIACEAGGSTLTPIDGIKAAASAKVVHNAGLKASLELKDVLKGAGAVEKLLGNVAVEYAPFSLKLYEFPLGAACWFKPLASGFTKISAAGQDLPPEATTWSCVRHNATGLLWEAHVARQAPAHTCALSPYFTCTGYTNFGDGRTHDASTVPATVDSLCGKVGWRLPTEAEGRALVGDAAYAAGNKTAGAFQDTWFGTEDAVHFGWISSPVVGYPDWAWYIDFSGGIIHYGGRDYDGSSYSVRLVAGP